MITFSCPGCQATFRLPDEIAGKSARCSKCNHRFTVPGGSASGPGARVSGGASRTAPTAASPTVGGPAVAPPKPAAASRPASASATPAPAMPAASPKKAALNPVPEVLEAEIVDDEPPRPARRSEPVYDDVEVADDLDERPPPRRARRVEDDDVDDYDRDDRDDLDDGRPRRRRIRRKSGGSLGWILATLGGVSMVLMVIFLIMMMVSGSGGGGGAPIINPQIVNGMFQDNNSLTRWDAQDRARRMRAKEYRIELQQGKSYVIDMESTMFDTYLRLLDANGAPLLENDDFNINNLNSRIVFTPMQTATYTIVATSFNGGLGAYRLTIREQNLAVK